MTTAAAVLNVARSQLGTLENPLGSNNVVYNTWYYGRRVSGGSYPWCAVFVSYVADRAGALAAGIIPRHAYTPSGVEWFRDKGRFGSTPKVGAIAYYNFGGLGRVSHCGIVEAVHSDGTWTAIEGNTDVAGGRTGGRVMRQRRSYVGTGGGFGYPAYTQPPPPVTDEAIVRAMQQGMHFRPEIMDGVWGPQTDRAVYRIRQAAYGSFPDGVKAVQVLLGNAQTGTWSDADQRDLISVVEVFQRSWGIDIDGDWGPETERTWKNYQTRLYRG